MKIITPLFSTGHQQPSARLIHKAYTLCIALVLWAAASQAQPWMQGLNGKENPTFYEIQASFNDFWAGKTVERGKGFKAFKRWEWYWQQRVDADGNFPPAGITYTEMERYQAEKGNADPEKSLQMAGNWTSMGPTTSTGGYVGIGRINCIVFHPTQTSTIFVGTAGGGLWKSTNNGSSWTSMTDFLQVLGVSGLAINPNNPNEMYLATGDGDGADSYSLGVLKSTDGGVTWNTTGLTWVTTNYRLIRKLIMHPNNSSLLLAATSNGIWRTTNAGQTWTSVLSGNYYDVEFKPNSTSTFYVSGSATVSNVSYGRVYRSVNDGLNWTLEHEVSGVGRTAIAVSPANSEFVAMLCASSEDSGFGGFYASTDGGDTYSLRSSSPNLMGWATTGNDTGGQGWYDLCIAVDPTNANTIYVGGVNTWKSTNGGVNWTINTMWYGVSGIAEAHADKHDLIFQNSTTLYQANDGGIYRTSNGGVTWTDISNGLAISQMYRLGCAQTTTAVITGLQDNSSKLRSATGVWTQALATGDGMESAIDPTNASVMYTESYYGEIRRSTNGGQNWTDIQNNIAGDPSGAWVTPYILDPSNSQTIYAGYQELYKSTDRGNTWTTLTGGVTQGRTIHIIAVAPSSSSNIYIYATGSAGRRVYKSTNAGATWTTATYPPGPATDITSIAVHPTDPNTIWITYAGYSSGHKVYQSTNGGSSWTNFSGTLPNISANTIIYQTGSNGGLYLGMDAGVYYRDATMTDWMLFNNGLPNVEVIELEIQYTVGKLRAATYGRGLWESDLFQSGSTCTAATAAQLSTTNIGATTARLNCSLTGITSFDWRYRVVGSSTWIDLTAAAASFIDLSGLTPSTNYEFQTQVVCTNGGTSGWSVSKTFTTTACTAPSISQLSASSITDVSAQLNCSLTGVNGYDWRYRQQGNTNWLDLPSTTTGTSPLSGLTASTIYEFQVSVLCNATWSSWSSTQTFTTISNTSCAAPNLGQISANPVTYNTARFNCTITGVSNYDWQYRLLGTTTWLDLPTSTVNFYDVTGLSSSSQYELQVRVQCGSVWSAWSGTLRFTTPAPPCPTPSTSMMFVNTITTNSATLNSLVTGVVAYDWRYRVQGTTTWTDLNSASSNFAFLTGLIPTTTYEYQGAVQCSSVWSEWSASNTFTTNAPACSPPTALQLSVSNINTSSATLNCSLVGAQAYGWRYRISGAATWTTPANTATGTINLSSLAAATLYEYQAAVQCQGVWTDWSATQNFTTLGGCNAPLLSQLTVSNLSSSSARLNCSLSGVNAYDWRYRLTGAASWIDLNSTTTNFTDLATLLASTAYEFQVSVQCGSIWSSWSSTQSFVTNAPPCPAPELSQLVASSITINSARLNCTLTGVTNYDWRYRVVGASSWIDLASSPQNFFDLFSLSPSTTYEFQSSVQCGGISWSVWSASKTFTTLNAPCTEPNLGQIYANNITTNSAQLNCSLTANISEYDWRYRPLGAANWIELPATTTNFTSITGLNASSSYEFQVAVRCGTTWSLWSFQLRFITLNTTVRQPGGENQGEGVINGQEPQGLEQIIADLKLQPIPARQHISLRYRVLSPLESGLIEIYDLNGKRLISRSIGQEQIGEHQHEFELSELQPGIYLIKLQSAQGTLFRRFLKAGR